MSSDEGGQIDPRVTWRHRLRSIEAAALAGIVCSIGWALSLRGLLSAPGIGASNREVARYYSEPAHGTAAVLWLQVTVFSTISFLWFVGVVRGRIGEREPKLAGTVFFGGSILLASLLFVGTALLAAPAVQVALGGAAPDPGALSLLRAVADVVLSIFLPRVAMLVMFSTANLAWASGALPRWLVVLTVALGVVELVNVTVATPTVFLLPAWIALVSVVLLVTHPVGAFPPAVPADD